MFFDSAYQSFCASLQNRESKKFYRLGGSTLCLFFAKEAWADTLTPALEHLRIEPTEAPDLTLCVWEDPLLHSQVSIGLNNERIYAVIDIHTQVLHMIDQERKIALYCIKDWKKVPWWISGSPFQLIFHWWMSKKKLQLTHAAAVGRKEGGVLLAGKSGSGKSTVSLACMEAGMQYISEDYCLVSDHPQIHSVYNSAKLEEKTVRWFPELERQIANPHRAAGDKAFLFHHQFQPEKILLRCPLKSILTLRIENTEKSWLETLDPKEVLAPLCISTIWQLTSQWNPPQTDIFLYLKKIAEALPCYRLHLGSDLTEPPRLIEKLL